MKGSESLRSYIRSQEQFRSRPYLDPPGNKKGQYSTAYGHVIRPNEKYLMNKVLTKEEAENILDKDLAGFEASVNRALTRPVSQGQFDALVDLAYNAGPGAAAKVAATWNNTGDVIATTRHMQQFDHAGGQVLPVLTARRQYDADLFAFGVSSVKPSRMLQLAGAGLLIVIIYLLLFD